LLRTYNLTSSFPYSREKADEEGGVSAELILNPGILAENVMNDLGWVSANAASAGVEAGVMGEGRWERGDERDGIGGGYGRWGIEIHELRLTNTSPGRYSFTRCP
jgi:hypothetical protein